MPIAVVKWRQKNKKNMTENKTPTQETVKLSKLLEISLTIPPYQRPYKWKEYHVTQLLDDIFEFTVLKNKTYRIGSIIIHEDKNSIKNIVDGQQRLITISLLLLLLKKLDDNDSFNKLPIPQKYKHRISKENISRNWQVIDKWLQAKFRGDVNKLNEFHKQILDKCEFVLFTVYKDDEAFQLFDSQNARGKDLEPYDLLKAFHLREMGSDSEQDRERCIERWEKSVDDRTLKPILGNHLYRIRKWAKNEWSYDFTKSEINEFKGISLHRNQLYPYESSLRMLDGFVENAQKDKFLRNLHVAQSFPFSITMPIINGKRFFEYVDFYILQREKLFDLNKDDLIHAESENFVEFFKKYCTEYPGSGRSGDEKVRNLYENILLAFIDKFGFVDDFENFYTAFYKAVYSIRCNSKRIGVESILNSSAKNILQRINDAVNTDSLKIYQFQSYKIEKQDDDMVKGIGFIKEFINK
jgi:hypothetical protein